MDQFMTETENGLVKKTSSQDFLSYFSVVGEKIVSSLHERAPYYLLINRYVPIKVHGSEAIIKEPILSSNFVMVSMSVFEESYSCAWQILILIYFIRRLEMMIS